MEDSGWFLLGLIVLPVLLVAVIVGPILRWVIYQETNKRESWGNLIALNPDYGLAKQTLFWIAILAPILYFFAFGLLAWHGYELSLTTQGFGEFIQSSKLPLGLASLSIPITALVAKLHSTAQTARQIGLASRQIAIAEKKNNNDLFYSHRKEFVYFYDVVGKTTWANEYETAYKIDPRIHSRLFKGDASEGVPVFKLDIAERLFKKLKVAERLLSDVITGRDLEKAHKDFLKYSINVFYLIEFFGIVDLKQNILKDCITMPYFDGGGTMREQYSAGVSSQQAVAIYRCVKSYLLSSVEFAGNEPGIAAIKRDEVDYVAYGIGYLSVNPDGLTVERVVEKFRYELSPEGTAKCIDLE